MSESLINLIQEARNYLIDQIIGDQMSGKRSSLDVERTDLVVRMDKILRDWNSGNY